MTKLSVPEQEKKMQEWHPILTAAIAPVFIRHFLGRSDYAAQLDNFATQIQEISFDPKLSEEEKVSQLNSLDHRVVLAVNSVVAHQTHVAVNVILQRTFPEVYAAHAPQTAQMQDGAEKPPPITVNIEKGIESQEKVR